MRMETNEHDDVLQRACQGDTRGLNELFEAHRTRLCKMVKTRLNPQIQGRVDASDVVQDSFLEATKRLREYVEAPKAPLFLWLRQILGHKIIDVHRRHLGADARNAELEISLQQQRPQASSVCIAAQLIGNVSTPSRLAIREETRVALQDAINQMDSQDREILVLRQFEELSNIEAAAELGIEPAAASKRFVRALQRLQRILVSLDLMDIRT